MPINNGSVVRVCLALFLIGGLNACSRSEVNPSGLSKSSTSSQSTLAQTVSTSATPSSQHTQAILQYLGQIINEGYQVYGLAQGQDWQSIHPLADKIKQQIEDLESQSNFQPQDLEGLKTQLVLLSQASTAQDTQATLRAANEMIFEGAQLLAQGHPQVPLTAMQLEYYGRDLAITVMAKDNSSLRAQACQHTLHNLQKTWAELKTQPPHGNADVIQKIGHAVQQLDQAKTLDEYKDPTEDILTNTHQLIQSLMG